MQDEGDTLGYHFASGVRNRRGSAQDAGDTLGYAATAGARGRTGQMQDEGDTLGYHLASGVRGRRGEARDAGDTLGWAAAQGAEGEEGNMQTIGYNLAMGIANGIASGSGAVAAAAANAVSNAVAAAQAAGDIHSPSRKMRDMVGRWIPAGIAVGIQDYESEATDAAKQVMDDVNDTMADATHASYMNGSYKAQIDHSLETSMKATPIQLGLNVNMPNAAFKGLVRSITNQQNVDMELGLS